MRGAEVGEEQKLVLDAHHRRIEDERPTLAAEDAISDEVSNLGRDVTQLLAENGLLSVGPHTDHEARATTAVHGRTFAEEVLGDVIFHEARRAKRFGKFIADVAVVHVADVPSLVDVELLDVIEISLRELACQFQADELLAHSDGARAIRDITFELFDRVADLRLDGLPLSFREAHHVAKRVPHVTTARVLDEFLELPLETPQVRKHAHGSFVGDADLHIVRTLVHLRDHDSGSVDGSNARIERTKNGSRFGTIGMH